MSPRINNTGTSPSLATLPEGGGDGARPLDRHRRHAGAEHRTSANSSPPGERRARFEMKLFAAVALAIGLLIAANPVHAGSDVSPADKAELTSTLVSIDKLGEPANQRCRFRNRQAQWGPRGHSSGPSPPCSSSATHLSLQLVAASILMSLGVWLHFSEDHNHEHEHEPLSTPIGTSTTSTIA